MSKSLSQEYVENYMMIEQLEARNSAIKKMLCESDFMEDVMEDGVKLTRVVTQKFIPNKSVEEMELLYPDAVLVEIIPPKPEETIKTINVDLLKVSPDGHEYLEVKRSETVKVTKPKAAK